MTNFRNLFSLMFVTVLLFACNSKKIDQNENSDPKTSANEAIGPEANSVAPESNAGDLDPSPSSTLPDRVFFAYDSFELVSEAKEAIQKQAEFLKSNASNVIIEGHCDERGTAEYNMALGYSRANAVKKRLVFEGVAENKVKTVSYGKSRPAVEGDTEYAYQQNRRAVLVIK